MSRFLVIVTCVGCGNVRNMTPPPPPDGAAPTTILVATTGNDANDGVTGPVRTVKRALGLATADTSITGISIAAGRYDAANGESFPYSVPSEITMSGPAGGGAVLAGSGGEPALMVASATLINLEFESFAVATIVTETSTLSNLRVRSSGIAIRGETASDLTIDHVDVTGATCSTGVELNGAAKATVDTASTRMLGHTFDLHDRSTLALTNSTLTGDPACNDPSLDHASVNVGTSGAVTIDSTLIDGGYRGISLSATTSVTLANTTIRNVTDDAIVGNANVTITGGELSNNGRAGIETAGGTWSLTNVALKNDGVMAIYIQGDALTMRGCTVTGNPMFGVYIFGGTADLGTASSPGGNTFQGNGLVGVDLDATSGTVTVPAVGNTWRPNVQGADAQGHYSAGTVTGPVARNPDDNFAIATSGWNLQH
jgi:Protein of unknown function (DUF1565)/Right handed beta helix region